MRVQVQEAHKNAHRRLRQLEVVHAHVGMQGLTIAPAMPPTPDNMAGPRGGVAGSGARVGPSLPTPLPPAAVGSSTRQRCVLGGSTALHEGVWLYLRAVRGVLDTWAASLGLGGTSRLGEGKSKGSKRTHPG